MTVTGNGVNNLDIVLKHQYSQITTKLDARQVGNISAVTNATISPVNSSADISFTTNALTYNGSINQPVSFSAQKLTHSNKQCHWLFLIPLRQDSLIWVL